MAGTVGKLVVTLTARTGKFQKGLRKAGSMVGNFASGVAGITKKIFKFGAIMATAAVAGIAYFTKQAFASIDATAKLARQIGISIDGLRGLNRAAIITGASQEDVTKAVGVFTKTIGEAAVRGIGLGKDALDALGLSAEDLIKLPVDQSVAIIADEMNKLGTQSEKAYVASKLFGRGGLAMINTLALGSKGLAEMTAGAITLQGSLSAFDAAKVEEANDAIADMRLTWTGMFERIAVVTAPMVKWIGDTFAKLFIWIRKNAATMIPKIIDWFKNIVSAAAIMATGIWNQIKQIPNYIRFAAVEMYRIWKTGIIRIRTEWTTFSAIFSTGWEGIGTLIADMWDNVKIAFFNAISWIGNKLSGFAKWLVDKLPGENEWAQNLIKGYDQGLNEVDQLSKDIEQRGRDRWSNFWAANQKGAQTLTKDMDNLKSELDILNKALTGTQAEILAGRDSGKGWAVAIKNIIGDIQSIKLPAVTEAFAKGGTMAGDSLAEAVKTITTPAAIEKGTVAAFSSTVQSTYKALADTGKRTVNEIKENNKLQRETNRLLEAGQTATVGIK